MADNADRLSCRTRLVRISRGVVPDTSYTREIYDNIEILNLDAFHKMLLTNFPEDYVGFVYMPNAFEVEVYCTSTTSASVWENISASSRDYKDPSEWLVFHHTENMFVNTSQTNSLFPRPLTSFIVSPPSPSHVLLDSIKLVLRCTAANVTSIASSNSDTAKVVVELFNFTTNKLLLSQELSIEDVFKQWRNHSDSTTWTSVQLYDISAHLPTAADCIWQLKVAVKNPLLSVGIDSIQNIYYTSS